MSLCSLDSQKFRFWDNQLQGFGSRLAHRWVRWRILISTPRLVFLHSNSPPRTRPPPTYVGKVCQMFMCHRKLAQSAPRDKLRSRGNRYGFRKRNHSANGECFFCLFVCGTVRSFYNLMSVFHIADTNPKTTMCRKPLFPILVPFLTGAGPPETCLRFYFLTPQWEE